MNERKAKARFDLPRAQSRQCYHSLSSDGTAGSS